jgi:uncharacterized MnhB-related membrane protein
MSLLEIAAYLVVALLGGAVVLTKRPLNQLFVYSAFGTALALLFFILHAPDVSLSEISVGTLAVPLLVLVVMMKTGSQT